MPYIWYGMIYGILYDMIYNVRCSEMICDAIPKYCWNMFARYWNGLRHVDSGECSLFRESLEIWSVAHLPPWVAIQASRCAGRVNMILAVKTPGVSLPATIMAGGYTMWGTTARHDRRFVAGYSRREREFVYQTPQFSLSNVLSFTGWYIRNMPCASFYEWKLLNFKNCADHRMGPSRGLIFGRSYKPGV